jgi:hypothetical protein
VEGCITLAQSHPVDLSARRQKGELGEFQEGELAKSHGRSVLELNFCKTIFGGRELEPFLNGRVDGGLGPIRNVGSLNGYGTLHKAQAHNASVGVLLSHGRQNSDHQEQTCPQEHG